MLHNKYLVVYFLKNYIWNIKSENMWHFIMLSENIYHISRKGKELPFYFILLTKKNGYEIPLLAMQLQLYSAQKYTDYL
jgi:hypothetical protein